MRKLRGVVSICAATAVAFMSMPNSVMPNSQVVAMSLEQIGDVVENRTMNLSDADAKIILQEVKDKILQQYGADYKFDHFKAIFVDVENAVGWIDFDVIADMTLIKNPLETPYYYGMMETMNALTDEYEKALAQQEIDEYLEEQWSYYNVPEETTFCYRIQVPTTFKDMGQKVNNSLEMSVKNGLYDRIDLDQEEVVLSEIENETTKVDTNMQKLEGNQAIAEVIKEKSKTYSQKDSAVTYSASDAVKYAKNHATDEPEFSKANGMGSDCANFVSKCLNAGGIPVDKSGKWYPSPSAGKYAGVNWMRTGYYKDSDGNYTGVKTYMVSTKGYFKKVSSSSKAKKGGFMFWNTSSHVALVYANVDGTLKYAQHSNVQQKKVTKTYSNEDVTFYNPDL